MEENSSHSPTVYHLRPATMVASYSEKKESNPEAFSYLRGPLPNGEEFSLGARTWSSFPICIAPCPKIHRFGGMDSVKVVSATQDRTFFLQMLALGLNHNP